MVLCLRLMSNLNQQVKEQLTPDVFRAAEWAHVVHENTMQLLQEELTSEQRAKLYVMFTLDEREEARKIILEYGLGKPTRIVEHRGSKKQPIQFATTIVPTQKQLPVVDAELITEGE